MKALFWLGPRDGFEFELPGVVDRQSAPSEIRLPIPKSPMRALYRSRLIGGYGTKVVRSVHGRCDYLQNVSTRHGVVYDFIREVSD